MKLYFLHSGVPGVRYYRMNQPADWLNKRYKHDIYLENTSLEGMEQSDWQLRALDPQFHAILQELLGGIDMLVVQMVHTQEAMAVLQGIRACFGIPIVLEVDDDYENVPQYNRASSVYRPNTELQDIILELLRTVDAITVSTNYLKKQYQRHNPNVYVLPNSLDFALWDRPVEIAHKESLRIGWVGAQTHEDDMKMVAPAIREVLDKYPHVKFYFIGGVPTCINKLLHPRVVKKTVWYNILDYPRRVRQWGFDIGIAPLRDNQFNRAKSNLRWLEYSAMGIPSVVARVEPFKESVKDGVTGMFAYEPEEWVEKLSALIESVALRKRIGVAARQEVVRRFNIKTNVAMWDECYKRVIAKNKAKVRK